MSERQNIDPDELAMLDEEQAFLNNSTKQARRIRVEKGDVLTIRFLPMEFGPKKWFYQRIAFHWIGKRPYYCEKHTAAECGGNPDAQCELCAYTEKLNSNRDRNVANAGFRAMANPQYILYCLLFEREKDGEVEKIRGPERWKAWEFPMPKTSFGTLLQLYRRSLARQPDKGFLNLVDGNDITVSLPGRDYAFQREDSQPITNPDDPDKFQETVNKIWASIQLPVLRVPTDDDWDKAIERIEESIGGRRGGGRREDDRGGGRRSGGARGGREEDDEPRSRRRGTDDIDDEPRGRRRAGDEAPDDDEPRGKRSGGDDAEDIDDRGPRREREPEERRSATPPSVAASARPTPPSVSRPTPPPPAARTAPPPPAARTPAASPPPPPRVNTPAMAPTGPATSSIDDEDNVTDEARDPAPTASPEETGAAVVEGDAPPPAVETPPGATTATTAPNLKSRLTRGIAAAKERM